MSSEDFGRRDVQRDLAPTRASGGARTSAPTRASSGSGPTRESSGSGPTRESSGSAPTRESSGSAPTRESSGSGEHESTQALRALEPGALFAGRYRLRECRGGGGFGVVWIAEDLRLGRLVAVKVLRPDRPAARFEHEARALARLQHPSVVTVHDAFVEDGWHALVMELVPGESLAQRLDRGVVAWDELARLAAQAAAGLAHAHQRGILHRDVKPANLLLAPDGTLKVGDFGTARLLDARTSTSDGSFLGTAPYAPPEAFGGRRADERGDIYALGVVLYEGLCGRRPFEAETLEALVARILSGEPPPLTCGRAGEAPVPAQLERLVLACLARDPAARPGSALELERSLRTLLVPGAAVAAPDLIPLRLSTAVVSPPSAGERRRLVLLELDERHLGALEEWSSSDVSALRQQVMAEVLPVVDAHGGLVAEVRPDSLSIVFGLPRVGESDAARAVDCARRLVEGLHARTIAGVTLSVAAAVHVARAVGVPSDPDWRLPPEARRVAERLRDAAADGTVVASEAVVEESRGRFRFATTGELLPLRESTSRRVAIHELRGAGPRDDPGGVPLVGREPELQLALSIASAARRGQGALLSIEGPAGIGKTRLAQEIAARWDAEGSTSVVAVVGGQEIGGGPLQLVRDLDRALVETVGRPWATAIAAARAEQAFTTLRAGASAALHAGAPAALDVGAPGGAPDGARHGDALDPATARERRLGLRLAWQGAIACLTETAPTCLVVEDVHWADEPSCDLLAELGATAARQRFLLVVTSRPDAPGEQAPWRGRPWHRPLVLGPLAHEAERDLLCSFLEVETVSDRVIELLAARSEGHPLYALELARALVERGLIVRSEGCADLLEEPTELEAPATLQAIFNARVDRLAPRLKEVLKAAAVVGAEVEVDVLTAVLDEPRAEVEDALRELRRRDLLLLRSAAGVPVDAFHHALLRDVVHDGILRGRRRELHRRTGEALLAKAHAAATAERLRYDVAAPSDRLEEAARHLALGDRPLEAVPHLLRAADARQAASDWRGALVLAREAVSCCEAARTRGTAPPASAAMADGGDVAEALEGTRARALEGTRARSLEETRARALETVARCHLGAGDAAAAIDAATEAVDVATEAVDAATEAVDAATEAVSAASGGGEEAAVARARLVLAEALLLGERAAEGLDEASAAEADARHAGDLTLVARALGARVRLLAFLGRTAEVEPVVGALAELSDVDGEVRLRVVSDWVRLLFAEGQCQRALDELELAREAVDRPLDGALSVRVLHQEVALLLALCRLDEARRRGEEGAERARAAGLPQSEAYLASALAEVALLEGEHSSGLAWCERAATLAAGTGREWLTALAGRTRALLLRRVGRLDEAREQAASARRQAERLGARALAHEAACAEAMTCIDLGHVREALAAAHRLHAEASEGDGVGGAPTELNALLVLVRALRFGAPDEVERRREASAEALRLARTIEEPETLVAALLERSRELAPSSSALAHAGEARALAERSGLVPEVGRAALVEALAHGGTDPPAAAEAARRALAVARRLDWPELEWEAAASLADAARLAQEGVGDGRRSAANDETDEAREGAADVRAALERAADRLAGSSRAAFLTRPDRARWSVGGSKSATEMAG